MKKLLLTATLTLAAAPAMAHTGGEHASGLMAGLAHPLNGLDHILAMVAVGILAMQQGGGSRWALPLAFVAMMLVSGAMGMVGLSVPGVELGIAGSVVLLGLVIALGRQIKLALAAPMVAFLAVFHGVAHGAEMPAAMSGVEYALGFAAATLVLHAVGLVFGYTGQQVMAKAAPMVLRLAGVVTAALGLGLIAG